MWCANWCIAFSAAAVKQPQTIHLPTTNKYSREPCEYTTLAFTLSRRYSVKACRCVTSLPFSSFSVQGHQKPAAPYPVHWAGPQPVQMQDRRLPQVFPQGVSAALPHEVLSRTERAKPPWLRPDALLRQTEPKPGDPSQAPDRLGFPPLVHFVYQYSL